MIPMKYDIVSRARVETGGIDHVVVALRLLGS